MDDPIEIIRAAGIRIRIPIRTQSREDFERYRRWKDDPYPDNMLLPDGSINWGSENVFGYIRGWLPFEIVKELSSGPYTIDELKNKVSSEIRFDEGYFNACLKGLAKGEYYWIVGLGSLKGLSGKIYLEFNPEEARKEYQLFRIKQ